MRIPFVCISVLLILTACGLFRKERQRKSVEVTKERVQHDVERRGVTVDSEIKEAEFTELILRIPKDEAASIDTQYENLQDAIVDAISRSEQVILRHKKTSNQHSEMVDTTFLEKTLKELSDSAKSEDTLHKKGNTSLSANIPLLVWILVTLAVLVGGYVFLKKYRIL